MAVSDDTRTTRRRLRRRAAPVFAAVLGIVVVLAAHGSGHLLRAPALVLWLGLVPVVLGLAAYVRRSGTPVARRVSPAFYTGFGLLVLAIVSTCSSWTGDGEYFFLRWLGAADGPRGVSAATAFVLLTVVLAPLFALRRVRSAALLLAILVVAQLACLAQFLGVTHGAPLYRDDHPSFIFRLWEFSRTFPQLINYNPYWNGGVVAHTGTSSGIMGPGLPLWPLWKLVPTPQAYTAAIAVLFIVVAPWIVVGSLRMMRGGRAAAYAAGVLALGVSHYYFKWLLHFGTVGASLSAFFIIPVAASLYRVHFLGRREPWLAAVLAASMFFLCLWPPGAIAVVGMAIGPLIAFRRVCRRELVFLVACALVFVLLYGRNLAIILFHSTTFQHAFVDTLDAPEAKAHFALTADVLRAGGRHLAACLRGANPLLIFLGLIGVGFHPSRRMRQMFMPLLALLLVVAGWAEEYFPDLQLRRMATPLFFAAVPPAAMWISRLLAQRGLAASVAQAALVALLAMSGWNSAAYYANKSSAKYVTPSPQMHELIDWIVENTPEDGRLLFAGRTVHKYGGGHVAALPLLTGREMMACDYYHFPMSRVEYEYPPRLYRKRPERMRQFMDHYNVSHVIAYQANYRERLDQWPEHYEAVFAIKAKNIHVYRVRRESTPFLRNSGRVVVDFNNLRVRIDQPGAEAVIPYNWADGLLADEPAEIYPVSVDTNVTLIGVRAHGQADVRIRFRGAL